MISSFSRSLACSRNWNALVKYSLARPSLAEIEVVAAHCPVAHGKIRIKLDGTLMVRQGCGGAFLITGLSAKAVRFQSFERRRGGLFERNIKLLHRSQRFAQLAAQLGCRLAQRVQHLLLGRRRHLLLASVSPLWQFTAFSPSTYSLPRLPIDPAI